VFDKTVICPLCKHYISVSIHDYTYRCQNCGKFFDYRDFIPFYQGVNCLENPKRHRHPDWIEQNEEREGRMWL
jgi:transposase-like protein